MRFIKGQREPLKKYLDINIPITVAVQIKGRAIYDTCCFIVSSEGKIISEDYLVFYNQKETPEGAVCLNDDTGISQFRIDLNKLPPNANKLVFTISIDGEGFMGEIDEYRLSVNQNNEEYIFMGAAKGEFFLEKSVICAEIYKKDTWRLYDVNNGFNEGLVALLEQFGVEVGDASEESTAAEPESASAEVSTITEPENVAGKASTEAEPESAPAEVSTEAEPENAAGKASAEAEPASTPTEVSTKTEPENAAADVSQWDGVKLYQVGYHKNSQKKWTLVSASADMSRIAMQSFKDIIAKLKDLGDMTPEESFGVFRDGRFIFIIKADFDREKGEYTYFHCMCCNIKEYLRIMQFPMELFGYSKAAFPVGYNENVKHYDVLNQLPYEKMSVEAILGKYGISQKVYISLIGAAISAIMKMGGPLCIVIDREKYNQLECFKEIMFLIMSALPYHLRIIPSLYSCGSLASDIFVSDKARGNNVFDLENKEVIYNDSIMSKYRFMQLYSMYVPGSQPMNETFMRIAGALEYMRDKNFMLEDVTLEDIDNAYNTI